MRISEKDLQTACQMLNAQAGFVGKQESLVGSYSISFAYGGACLHQYVNDAGAVNDVLNCGYTTKKALFIRIQAFMLGLETR